MAKRMTDLERWYRVDGGSLGFPGAGRRTIEVRLNSVGPCVVRCAPWDMGNKKEPFGEAVLVGCFEGQETFQVTVNGHAALLLEPTVEVWALRDMSPVAMQVEQISLTRLEKPGVYMDELGIALARQATLSRMLESQRSSERSRLQREADAQLSAREADLEKRLKGLDERIAALTPPVSDAATE